MAIFGLMTKSIQDAFTDPGPRVEIEHRSTRISKMSFIASLTFTIDILRMLFRM